MNREDLIREMMDCTEGSRFMTRPEFCRYLRISVNTAKKYLHDVEAVYGRRYHIDDIADAILASAKTEGEEEAITDE